MRLIPAALATIALAALAMPSAATAPAGDPFAFFRPTVDISAADRIRLDRGEPMARVLQASGRQIAAVGAIAVSIDSHRLIAWIEQIDLLKKGRYTTNARRFSNPPRLDDVSDLTLEDGDLADIAACTPKRCGLKLSAADIDRLQRARRAAGNDWKPAVQREFRQLVLARASEAPTGASSSECAALVKASRFLGARLPAFAAYLCGNKAVNPPVERFVYWSKDRLAGKPIVSVTDLTIVRSGAPGIPEVVVAGREVFATHYVDGSLGVTALVPGGPDGRRYLVYVNRTSIDVLRGPFANVVRFFVERRVRAEAAGVLEGLRQRLESGPPPIE